MPCVHFAAKSALLQNRNLYTMLHNFYPKFLYGMRKGNRSSPVGEADKREGFTLERDEMPAYPEGTLLALDV